MIAATIANVHRDPKRTPHPYQPQDFMPQTGDKQPTRRKQTPEEMEQLVILWNAALGGEDRRRLN